MTYYIGAIGVDGFRCDVGDEVPLDFWQEGIRRIRAINPDTVMINEGERAEHLSVFDANYGFYWHNCLFDLLTGTMTAQDVIAQHTHYQNLYPAGGIVLRDMDNHDTVTDWPYRIEAHFGSACMELILAINYTIDGVPMVYCGNELADRAKLSMFANRFYPGSFAFTNRNVTGADVSKRKEIIKMLNKLKAERPALYESKTQWFPAENTSVLAFKRTGEDEEIIFAGNFSEEATEVRLGDGEVLLSNNALIQNGIGKLSSYGYLIIRR
jgi:glycosidase